MLLLVIAEMADAIARNSADLVYLAVKRTYVGYVVYGRML